MEINAAIISQYFPQLTDIQRSQFEQLYPLYEYWNQQINVISRKDIQELYLRHVLHALGIAKICTFMPDEKVLDVGTGGGFPGIPLAILFPQTDFTLVDSIGKKIKVVQEVVNALGLKNVTAVQGRAEEVEGQFQFVISRAVTRLGTFYPWIRNKFSKTQINPLANGLLYLKGGDLKEEIQESKLIAKQFSLHEHFPLEFFETKYVLYVKRFI